MSSYLLSVELGLGVGIPVMGEGDGEGKGRVVGREVRACLFDNGKSEFVGNALVFKCRWDESYEDRWWFDVEKIDGEAKFLIR